MRTSHKYGASHSASDYSARAEINVTPLVDVMLVLLVVFMITAPLLASGIPVKLPKSGALSPENPRAPIIVTIARDGVSYLGHEMLAPRDLAQRVRAEQDAAQQRIVYVRGDSEAPYGKMVEVMAQLNAAGVARISLVAQSEAASVQAKP